MKRVFLIVLFFLLLHISAGATVRFGVGLNWIGETDMGMGASVGVGWKEFGYDFSHYGLQPTIHPYGTIEITHDRLGVYYQPFDYFMIQTGVHSTHLALSNNEKKVLGTKDSKNWAGPYVVFSVPIVAEEAYFIKPFYGFLMVENGSYSLSAYGISIGAAFDTDQKIFFDL